jgi:hypothetical protein
MLSKAKANCLLIGLVVLLLTLAAAWATTVQDAYCEKSEDCNNGVVATPSDDGVIRPKGCTQEGEGCAGRCQRCTEGSGSRYCKRKCGSTCEAIPDESLICGYITYYDCAGTWASACQCTNSNPVPERNTACIFDGCN